MSSILKNKTLLITHGAAVLLMIIASVFYALPAMQGKVLEQSDIIQHKSLSKETLDYREANGEEPLWTTRVFSGMTTANIGTLFDGNIMDYMNRAMRSSLPQVANIMFMTMLGFYLMMVVMGVNPWLALIAAVGYGYSSNLVVSLMAGHNTKVATIGYMAITLSGIFLVFRDKRYVGAVLTSLGVGLMVTGNHPQIIYYFIILGLLIAGVELFQAFKAKALPQFAKMAGLIAIAGIIGAIAPAGKLYFVYQQSSPTIRGGESTLSSKQEEDKGGLDWSYATSWSYGPLESLTTVVPSLMGGATAEALPKDGNVAEELKRYQLSKAQQKQIVANGPVYMGEQPFLLGTVYFGAAFIFFFILGLFLVKDHLRWWVISGVVLFFILAWGRHAEAFTRLFFDYLPLYNKFRTPSMALAIPGLLIPVLGIFGLNKVLSGQLEEGEFKKAFKYALYASGGLIVLLLFYGLSNDWIGAKDASFQKEGSPWAIDAIYEALLADRKSRYLSDWLITTLIMIAGAGIAWFGFKKKFSPAILYGALAIIVVGDMWRVSKRYLDNDDFVSARDYDAILEPKPADLTILADPDPHYRVLNLSVNPWTDGPTCYHHRNVGGHHAAKLQRYQELIENQLTPQLQKIQSGLTQAGDGVLLNPAVSNTMPVYNMLDTKYFILQSGNPKGVVENKTACGAAWFVTDMKKVSSADEEMAALSNFDPNNTVIVESEYQSELYDYQFGRSANAKVELTSMTPKLLTYSTSNEKEGLAVFSEVYYPKGWEVTIDGSPADVYRVNYVLRAMKIPAGNHEIKMEFKPVSYSIGQGMSMAGTVLFLLFSGGMLYLRFRKNGD